MTSDIESDTMPGMSTSQTGIPEGWSYEGPDPSVGIFGHSWFHDCEDHEQVVLERLVESHNEGEAMARMMVTTWELSCPCGATVTVTDSDWDPDCPEDIPDAWVTDDEAQVEGDWQ